MTASRSLKKCLAFALAASALAAPLSAHAATDGEIELPDGPTRPTPRPIDPLPPRPVIIPIQEIDTVDIGAADAACVNKFEYTKNWETDTADTELGLSGWTFGVGTGTKLAFVSDCTKTQFSADAYVRAQAFGAISVKALDVGVTGSTDKDHHNSLDVVLKVATFTIAQENIAQSDGPLQKTWSLSRMLPSISGMHDDSISKYGIEVRYKVGYNVVGNVQGSVSLAVDRTGLSVDANASAHASATVFASAGTTVAGHSVQVTGTGSLVVYDGSLAANAAFEQVSIPPVLQQKTRAAKVARFIPPLDGPWWKNNGWKITAGMTRNLVDALHGSFKVTADVDHGDITISKTIFSMGGVPAQYLGAKSWSYTAQIKKGI